MLAILLVAPAPAQYFTAQHFTAQQAPVRHSTAQQAATISVSTHSAEISDLLRQGGQLEFQRRWGEALTYYEDAIRRFPNEDSLQRRFDQSRLHYDIQRRYADASFLRVVADLPPGEALDLYAQVLLKVEAHYVEVPHWRELIERGTNNLEVALGEPAFVERNLPEQRREAADDFRRDLRQVLGLRAVDSRVDSCDAVATAAELAQRQLGILPTAVVLEYLCGATNALDPYSAYLTPAQLAEVYSQIDGNFVGLGIELKAVEGSLLIVRVIPGSPAAQAGLRTGDRILSIGDQATRTLSTDQAANLLQGEAGSVVELTVAAPAHSPRRVSICRQRVDVPGVDDVRIIDRRHGIAYLRLACFQKTTCQDLEAALWRLHRAGMKSLIMDLRGNPGGLLITAVEAVDMFVDRGIIVSTRGRSAQEDFTYSAHTAGTWRVPLVVLIDHDSASAAEIFAGAIRDHQRGTVVGTRSYGKGSVQGIFPLDLCNAGVRLTTARFYSPSGRPYSRIGVEPHVFVHQAARPTNGTLPPTTDPDAMLAAALEAAKRLGN